MAPFVRSLALVGAGLAAQGPAGAQTKGSGEPSALYAGFEAQLLSEG